MVTISLPINHQVTAIPLYVQIAEGLLEQIESGVLAPGDRLPAERELSLSLGVNRMTLRQALRVLEIQGLLIRQQGIGTYVAEPKIEREAGRLFPFTVGIQRRGYLPGAQVIVLEQQPAEVSVANKLQIPVSASVYRGHRLRFINKQPMMLENFFLPAHRFPQFERHDLENRSIYEVMETEYDFVVNQARQSLEAVSATEYEAKLLKIKSGDPLMLEQRLTYDQNGRPVEYAKDVYRGDRFRFVTELAALELYSTEES